MHNYRPTYQILTNDDQMHILCLSYFVTTVWRSYGALIKFIGLRLIQLSLDQLLSMSTYIQKLFSQQTDIWVLGFSKYFLAIKIVLRQQMAPVPYIIVELRDNTAMLAEDFRKKTFLFLKIES